MKRISVMRRGMYVALVLLVGAASISAQTPQGEFSGQTTVNVIEVPIRVVDPETGEPVRGLTAADFRVAEEGQVQEISNFSEISAAVSRDRGEAAETEETSGAVHETEEKPLEIVYFFDLFLMRKGGKERAVDALRDLYRSSIREGEHVSLVTFDGKLEVRLDRSHDAFDLQDALDEIEDTRSRGLEQYLGSTDALSAGTPSGERDHDFYERRQRAREYFFEMEKRVTRVGSALSAAMARFSRADGRRVVVAFTPGFPGASWSPSYDSVDFLTNDARYPAQDLWRQVSLEAADLGFTLFVIDSSGLRTSTAGDAEVGVTDTIGEIFAEGVIGGPANQAMREDVEFSLIDQGDIDPNARPVELGQWMERTRKGLLLSATETTGGGVYFDDDVDRAVVEVQDKLDHYYSLAYQAEHVGDGQEYEIEVELPGHPDFEVAHRTAYVDLSNSDRQAQRLRSIMLFGGDANPLGIRVEVGEMDSRFRLGAAKSKRIQIPFEIRIPFARIEMIPQGESFSGALLISFFGEDEEGNQSELSAHEQEVTLGADAYEEAVARGYFSYKATVEVEGGAQRVFVGVQDVLSGRTSIMPHNFDL